MFLMGAFLIGAVAGIAGYKAYKARPNCQYKPYPSYIDQLAKEYDLNEVQKQRIDSLLQIRDTLYRDAYKPYESLLDSLQKIHRIRYDSLEAAIRGTLTEEQRNRYDRKRAESKACNEQWKRGYDSAQAAKKAKSK
jgi:hypothetical protein